MGPDRTQSRTGERENDSALISYPSIRREHAWLPGRRPPVAKPRPSSDRTQRTQKGESRVKRFAFSLSLVFAIAALSTTAALAQPNLTGNWTVEETGERGSVNGAAAITQTANSFVGKTSGGASFNGKFCTPDVDKGCTSPLQVNGTWR